MHGAGYRDGELRHDTIWDPRESGRGTQDCGRHDFRGVGGWIFHLPAEMVEVRIDHSRMIIVWRSASKVGA